MPRSYSDDELKEAIRISISWNEVARNLGRPISTMRYGRVIAKNLGIDTSHFLGQSWNKGGTTAKKQDLEILLTRKDARSSTIRKRLIESGLKKECCEICGITEWLGLSPPLELDHINGDKTDNRLENLRILCCNCHAQTPTWRRGWKARMA